MVRVVLTLICIVCLILAFKSEKKKIVSEKHHSTFIIQSKPSPIVNKKNKTSSCSNQIVIYFDKYGFEPNELTVPLNSQVTVKNITDKNLLFEALANQPNQNNALNLGIIPPSSSKSFQVIKSGVWQFQANNQPEIRGEIGVGPLGYYPPKLCYNKFKNGFYALAKKTFKIFYDSYGFMPNLISVKTGTNIVIYNKSTFTQPGPMFFAPRSVDQSNIYQLLSLGFIYKQQQKSFIAQYPGIYKYQDVYQPQPKSLGEINVY